jgi:hypothetical protein
MEDRHGSYQSWHRNTGRIKKRSFNGIPVRTAPVLEETKRRKRHIHEKPGY